MAFGKSIAKRLFQCSKSLTHSPLSQHTCIYSLLRPLRLASPPCIYVSFYGHRTIYHPSHLSEFLDKLNEDHLRFHALREKAKVDDSHLLGITVNDARKMLKLSRVQKLKAKLSEIPDASISRSHYIHLCLQASDNDEDGAELAKMLDDSGHVIVLGNLVFLRPQQVAQTMEGLIGKTMEHGNDPRREELEAMEKQKSMIDEKAKALVRAELYCGLAFLVLQTLAFMRLTFWELSWDVMEPICFFFASFHFALAYLFFLKTSTEPSFQSYFFRRFATKQRRLMDTYHFDAHRYHELCTLFHPINHHSSVSKPSMFFFSPSSHSHDNIHGFTHK